MALLDRLTALLPSGLSDRLAAAGDLLWLATVGLALAAAAGVVALVAVLAAGTAFRAGAAAGVVVAFGALGLYLLFGSLDVSPGGEARQHAAFLVAQVALLLAVHGVVARLPWRGAPGLWLALFATVCATALAGWLAYFGGLGALRAGLGRVRGWLA